MKSITIAATCFVLGQLQGFSLADSPKPALCDAESGKWDPYHINCDFDCDAAGWEIKCVCDQKDTTCDLISCKVDKDGASDTEDILFDCTSNGDGNSPSCDLAPLLDSTLAGTCVKNTIKQVVDSWVLGVSD